MNKCQECDIKLKEGEMLTCGVCLSRPFKKSTHCVGHGCKHEFADSHLYKQRGNYCLKCIEIAHKKYGGRKIDLQAIYGKQ
jgi:hypothetical protein